MINLFDTAYQAVTRKPAVDAPRIDMCDNCWRIKPIAYGQAWCMGCEALARVHAS